MTVNKLTCIWHLASLDCISAPCSCLTICSHEVASLVLALTVQGEVFEPASESSTTPEIAEKSAKGEDEENHLHDLIANPEDEADDREALEGAKATTEMAGGVGAAVLGEKLKSLLIPLR